MKTAVTLMIFNRPNSTAQVFESIAKARPSKLLIVADGPRADRPGEAALCTAAREIVGQIDWPCEVYRNYSEINLGCRERVASGLDWVFSLVEDSIILEDDCLPHPDFFEFCDSLLDHYRDDDRVMAIGGDNFAPERARGDASYYFSQYCYVWGWATWRRAWRQYDLKMRAFPEFRRKLRACFNTGAEARHWQKLFRLASEGKVDTWDFQWQFAVLRSRGLTIVPNVNLVSNIGFGPDATHTIVADTFNAALPVQSLGVLRHPEKIIQDTDADAHYFLTVHYRSISRRIIDKWAVYRSRLRRMGL